jgi:transcriptional regulator
MYTPASFAEKDATRIRRLLEDHAFGSLVTNDTESRPEVSHLPLLGDFDGDDRLLRLRGHLARANPQASHLADGDAVLAIFHGPHAYVSPRHYDADFAVPTWNYAVVHVQGVVHIHTDADHVAGILDDLVNQYEPKAGGWRADWQDERATTLLQAVVAFDIDVHEVQAKFKLNQNRPASDQRAVASALGTSSRETERETARLMLEELGKDPSSEPTG